MDTHLSLSHAILLGIVQGATEFLPVSSSAHLVFAQEFLGVPLAARPMLALDICLHFGTLIAVVVYFWRDLVSIGRGFLWPQSSAAATHRRLGWMLMVGTIPAAVIGIAFKKQFETMFSDVESTAWQLIATGVLLWVTRWINEGTFEMHGLGIWRSLGVGVGQALAIIPGISRSGSTIAAALFFKLNRDAAARFSFLLSIPAIAGASLLSIADLRYFSRDDLVAAGLGTFVAFLVAFASITWLLGIIRRGKLSWFAIYCWVVGLAVVCLR